MNAPESEHPSGSICHECGGDLPSGGDSVICPRCLLEWGLGGSGDNLDSYSEARVPVDQRVSFFGDYELLKELGRGGMGRVYQARQVSLNRMVAVKVILGGRLAGQDVLVRFKTEAEMVAHLSHPNIVRIYEVGEHEGSHYYSMEYIDGEDLGRRAHHDSFSFLQSAEILETLAEAIQVAHDQEIIHRDLKPSNILVDARGKPHITDFGLAKQLGAESELTHTGQVLGSPNYMPPEQASGNIATTGVPGDVYGLGAILYQLMTGRAPFSGKTVSETLHRVVHDEVVSPRLLNPDIPRDLETICLKCLEKQPQRRYASASELAEELGRFRKNEPIYARPIGRTEHAWRWVVRNPVVSLLLLLLVLAVGIGFGSTYWQLVRLEEQSSVNQRQLAKLNVLNGVSVMDEGDYFNSLLWFAEAWKVDQKEDDRAHRLRMESVMSAGPRLAQIIGHGPDAVAAAAFSPVSDRLVTAGTDLTVRLWEVGREEPLIDPVPIDWLPYHVGFSADGAFIAVGVIDERGAVLVLDAGTGEVVLGPVPSFTDAARLQVFRPVFHPEKPLLVTQSELGRLELWNYQTGAKEGTVMETGPNILRLQFSDGGQRLWVTTLNGVSCWRGDTGERLALPRGVDASSTRVVVEPFGERVIANKSLVSGLEGERSEFESAPNRTVNWAQFSPEGGRILFCSSDRVARVYDAYSRKPLTEKIVLEDLVGLAAFRRDGRCFAIMSRDSRLRLWDTDWGHPITPRLPHDWSAAQAVFSGSGRYFLCVPKPHVVYVWDLDQAGREPVRLRRYSSRQDSNDRVEGGVVIVRRSDGVRLDRLNLSESGSLHPIHRRSRPIESWLDESGALAVLLSGFGMGQIWDVQTGLPLTPRRRGRFAIAESDYRRVDLTEFSGTMDEAEALVELLSAKRLDGQGSWEALSSVEVWERWNRLKSRDPDHFFGRGKTRADWHRNEAENAERVSDWFAAAFHWEQLAAELEAAPLIAQRWEHARHELRRLAPHGDVSVDSYQTFRTEIGQRSPHVPNECIDLSSFYNSSVKNGLRDPLLGLSTGLQEIDGTWFDLRGSIVMHGKVAAVGRPNLLKRVEGIPLGRHGRRLSFLHRYGYGSRERIDVALMKVRYTNGEEEQLRLINTVHLSNSWGSYEYEHEGTDVVWMGLNRESHAASQQVQVFRYTWENPHPDWELQELDIQALDTKGSYELLALTVE